MRNHDSDVREIERRGRDIEDGHNRLGGTNPDQIEADTEDDNEPNGIDRRMRVRIDLAPKATKTPSSALSFPHKTTSHDAMLCSQPTYLEKGSASSLANA